MSSDTQVFIVNNIKLPPDASHKEAFSVARRKLLRVGISTKEGDCSIYKRSIDARKKDEILLVYSVLVRDICTSIPTERLLANGITPLLREDFSTPERGDERLTAPPLIVGAGPAGLFAALILAENGYKPVIIERGGSIEDRTRSVRRFMDERILDTESNIQFGAGGAGTFSDGKLVTRVNDPYVGYVLKRFVDFGAPEEISYLARPHIGTDVLVKVIDRLIAHLISLGAKILYNTRYITSRGNVAVTSRGEIEYGALILAVGHSSRDTYTTLIESGYDIEAKNFSVGMRIEHLAADIDRALYGNFAGHPALGHAEYNLSYDTKQRGVYTFCMCPGGVVVPAASECGGIVVNGMSYHERNGRNSNSAVVCTVFKEDYGSSPIRAIEFQRKIEASAFNSVGGDYYAPIITVGDFLNDRLQSLPNRILPTYTDGKFVRPVRPNEYLPDFVCSSIKNALSHFDKKIHGFACHDAVLTGPETRTSAPVRILRDQKTRLAIGRENIYPCGEGAGYAGGITSAAIDGIKTAAALITKYSPF